MLLHAPPPSCVLLCQCGPRGCSVGQAARRLPVRDPQANACQDHGSSCTCVCVRRQQQHHHHRRRRRRPRAIDRLHIHTRVHLSSRGTPISLSAHIRLHSIHPTTRLQATGLVLCSHCIASRAMKFNLFHILGDVSHTSSKLILIWAIHANSSAEGTLAPLPS